MHARELEVVTRASPSPARQGTATIAAERPSGQPPSWLLDQGDRQLVARRAASCLLEPEPGDRVWFVSEGDQCFVLAVLERGRHSQPATLRVEGDAALRVSGQLQVDTGAGLELRSKEQVGVTSDELRVQARLGRVVFAECTAVLRSLFAHVSNSTFVAKVIETIADRLTQSSKTSLRSVAEVDRVQAGTIDHRAKEATHLAGGKVLVNGGELAKVEAGQIHLG